MHAQSTYLKVITTLLESRIGLDKPRSKAAAWRTPVCTAGDALKPVRKHLVSSGRRMTSLYEHDSLMQSQTDTETRT